MDEFWLGAACGYLASQLLGWASLSWFQRMERRHEQQRIDAWKEGIR